MERANLTYNNVTFSLNVKLLKLLYPLKILSFTEQQCHSIMKPILIAIVPKTGLVCTYQWALVHGPLQYVGLSIPNLHIEQLVIQHATVLWYSNQLDDTTGNLLWALTEAMHLEIGLHIKKILEQPVCVQHLVTSSWLKNLWMERQHHYDIHIQTKFPAIKRQQKQDIKLTHLFLQNG